ncbi:MAG TPA: hypothetical protein DCY42_06330 [Chloroflexi bacterium]|nr:hypothetical protein [Chloroflexota bacterium]
MTKKYLLTLVFTVIFASLLLVACGGNAAEPAEPTLSQEEQINQIYTQAAETLQAEIALTEAAQPEPTNTPQNTPTSVVLATNTPLAQESPSPFPTLPALPSPTPQPTKPATAGGRPCLRAELLFESPKDGVALQPGQSFVKHWNFANSGDCTWTENFSLVLVGGPNFTDSGLLSLPDYSNMTSDGIPNGGKLEVSVSMQAPATPGRYKSIWMLRDDNGQLFGVGALGDEIFWVEIVVRN